MSLISQLHLLRIRITYVYIAEATPTDPPLKLIFTGYPYILT